jgi:hypothetical protein
MNSRWSLILSVAAICIVGSSQAQASYSIIRWTSGFCQIWDNSTPWKPFPSDYKTGRGTVKTFNAAMATKRQLVARRLCW